MLSRSLLKITLVLITIAGSTFAETTAPNKLPKPQFQGDYFGEMARSFCTIREVDVKGHTLLVVRDKDAKEVRIPIKEDTELHFRDSWGELENYFPGQHVMLFMYVDEDRNWTYPRAIQDDIQVAALHGWYAAVTAIDPEKHLYSTHRQEKDKEGKVTKEIDKEFTFDPAVKVWKSAAPGAIDSLKIGDEVIQQLVEKDGKLVAVEIFDRAGDAAVRAAQEAQHVRDQDRLGLPAYVTDVEVISGSLILSIAWSGSQRATALKPGETVAIVPADGRAFAGAIFAMEKVDTRQRLRLAINARAASRLSVGESLCVFMPGTGPKIPTGKSGVPATAYK
ncbi:MAG TPA: hypothetical protein VG326_21040 [Tepidisphaeraceae bacterium]|jgi:hypothetical protein|nr:hypothetical protein [Tepidisphaeraceae bacterium]